MPNSRRRRFSVQHNIVQSNATKRQNGSQSSQPDSNATSKTPLLNANSSKSKNKYFVNSSKTVPVLEAVVECESSTSKATVRKVSVDKNVTASSSNIDLYNMLSTAEQYNEDLPVDTLLNQTEALDKRNPRQMSRRDRYPHQHRVKVRSPKRIMSVQDVFKSDKLTIGLNAIDWDQEMEEYINHVNVATLEPLSMNTERPSNHSLDDMCRICHGGEALSPELGQMISACACRGTVGRVHVKCLERWLTESGKSRCELCGTRYSTRRVHRYGLPKALIMWILSQNAKQLMVDSLGIMLMSPLAVLAAWLSGRTLAGLMTPETHVTPWPLASTFVLACMTLVCYYCWIVSAATRHALGWWIWYRSQYEVRLQLQENEE